MHKITYQIIDEYNNNNKFVKVKGIYVHTNVIGGNSGARCYIVPVKNNSTYKITRSAVTNRSLLAVTREYPQHNVDIVCSNYNMSNNLEIDVSTRDGNYILIYYANGTSESDSIKWKVKKYSNLINIFTGFEPGDYDSQTGNPMDNNMRIRSVSEEKVLIDSGTYTIDFKTNLTFGIRLYDVNEKFYTFIPQTNGSGKLTFNVTKLSYIKLIAETTNINIKVYLTRG